MPFIPFFLLVVFVSGVVSEGSFGTRLTTEKVVATENNTHYLFRYLVKDDTTGDYKTQEEFKEGDSVKGSYTIAEPNGDLRTVTYKAGPGRGFEATVDVQPSASPMKLTPRVSETPQAITILLDPESNSSKTEKPTTLRSNVKHFPGGFIMDVLSKPQHSSNQKMEMEVKFSINTNATRAATESTTPISEIKTEEQKATTSLNESTESTTMTNSNSSDDSNITHVKNTTYSTEARDMEDFVEKEINEAMNFLPKLPELILPDNETHFKFYKDPEEASIDDRITQIAKQLAETSLRREYEERKLGHFIPISVTPIERSTSDYLSKSFKLSGNDIPEFRPSEKAPIQVLTTVRLLPQDAFKDTFFSRISPVRRRLPVVSKPILRSETPETVQKAVTDALKNLKDHLAKNQEKGNEVVNSETITRTPVTVPLRIPQFLHLFTPIQPYTTYTQENVALDNNSKARNDFTTGTVPFKDATMYAYISTVSDEYNTNKGTTE